MELTHEEELKRQKRFAKLDDIDPEFRTDMQKLGKVELEDKLAELAHLEQANQNALKNDPKVSALKEELKNLMEPYRADTKAFKGKIEFLVYIGEQKGFHT
jgi:hypothetical protein